MIALRGVLYQRDGDKEENVWTWSGAWTFGSSLPPAVGHDLESLKLKIPNVRPFHYTFSHPQSASTVQVPSLAKLLLEQQQQQHEGEGEEEEGNDEHPKQKPKKTVETKTGEKHANAKQEKSADEKGDEKSGTKDPGVETAAAPASQAQTETNDSKKKAEKSISEKTQGTQGGADADADDANTNDENITFATMPPDDPAYTEAATLHPRECPPDGSWDGFFENIVRGRKTHNRVEEQFSLFLNATPSQEKSFVHFLDEADTATLDKNDLLQPGHIHARGVGKNQFGVFELLGSYDRATKVLEMQRIYILTSDVPSKPLASSQPRPNKATNATTGHRKSTSRSYSTRKRKLSWQRRSSLSDDEDEIVGMRRLSTNKKRPRSHSPGEGGKQVVTLSRGKTNPLGASASTAATHVPSSTTTPGPVSAATAAGASSQKRAPTPSQAVPAVAGTQAVPKKRASSSASKTPATTPSSSSKNNDSNAIKLPSVGDPDEARWRAAHYFYYQRNDVPPNGENGTAAATPAPATSFVVYEGEMLLGRCLREGRGVCLYNNGTLYEGEWKRNREHGKGTLMTADRRRIIYEGEWERGRMHGKGTYYFPAESATATKKTELSSAPSSMSPPLTSPAENNATKKEPPRYTGEFKENARHGTGKYYLPDGSTYDGEWRENLMSGRGTFTWPDGSIYIGSYTNGKRHGQGLLQASDKFSYDGMWVDDAMEGRGVAVYPGGQTYEGLWANGRREGRGTIQFTNGAIYEGRFRDDAIEGQGTMKMSKAVRVSLVDEEESKDDWMIPISFQSDIGHIHQRAGFTAVGE